MVNVEGQQIIFQAPLIRVFPMGHKDKEEEDQRDQRIFTLFEATELLPELEKHLTLVRGARAVLVHTKEEIKKASANAQYGGGSVAGPRYIQALEHINEGLHAIHELGVIVKDLDIGLCDFPYLMEDQIVYLCWKLGEKRIEWWHEIHSGYAGRHPLPPDAK
jgi:hypothetical protein